MSTVGKAPRLALHSVALHLSFLLPNFVAEAILTRTVSPKPRCWSYFVERHLNSSAGDKFYGSAHPLPPFRSQLHLESFARTDLGRLFVVRDAPASLESVTPGTEGGGGIGARLI